MTDKESFGHDLSGFINIDKPEDWTSHDVVAKLRKILKMKRIGHAGTLDPFATGVLPIAIGNTTRLIRFLKKSKRYFAEVDLRFTTDTDDYTGEKLRPTDKGESEEIIREKLKAFIGKVKQIPPLYSAKKINGKKLYELMRAGEPVDLSSLEPKDIFIKDITLLKFDYPKLELDISCGEGTYIRSIARDIGGHLTQLRRLESNGFDIKSSIRFEDLEDGDIDLEDLVLKTRDYIDLPEICFENKDIIALQQGQQIYLDDKSTEIVQDFYGQELSGDLDQEEKALKCLNSSKELIGLANILKKGSKVFQIQPKVIL